MRNKVHKILTDLNKCGQKRGSNQHGRHVLEFKELKNIDRTTMISVLEESFRNVLAKMFGTDENFDVIVNPDKGDFEIWRNREVVEERTSQRSQSANLFIRGQKNR